ncbi:unnamed protein product [Polarella glacialis]|uniref:Uncharacterized protein n=1 Tax=Polarella glacialis TaxID=89957 RepID=A0A813G6R7_POLGL|nr:unnamed protein product [Polarella glacialis]CAE8654980.1 unnamed protein product [Polarella glacialis]
MRRLLVVSVLWLRLGLAISAKSAGGEFASLFRSSKQKAFTKYQKRRSEASKGSETPMATEVERAKKYCQVIRAICRTQVAKVKIGQKKAYIKEIQVNGGSTEKKVNFGMGALSRR